MAKIQAANSGSSFTYSLIENDLYDARLVSLILIGMQKQPAYKGEVKPDSMVAKCAFELIGETVTVTDKDGNTEEKPAVVFKDYKVPSAGVTRGYMFDLIEATGAGEATFGDTEEYKAMVNLPVTVDVGSYIGKNDGKERNCVNGTQKMRKKDRENLEDSTVPTKFFCPYTDSAEMKEVYANLGNFIQGKLAEAVDKEHMPCFKDNWPTEPSDAEEDKDEF